MRFGDVEIDVSAPSRSGETAKQQIRAGFIIGKERADFESFAAQSIDPKLFNTLFHVG